MSIWCDQPAITVTLSVSHTSYPPPPYPLPASIVTRFYLALWENYPRPWPCPLIVSQWVSAMMIHCVRAHPPPIPCPQPCVPDMATIHHVLSVGWFSLWSAPSFSRHTDYPFPSPTLGPSQPPAIPQSAPVSMPTLFISRFISMQTVTEGGRVNLGTAPESNWIWPLPQCLCVSNNVYVCDQNYWGYLAVCSYITSIGSFACSYCYW